MTPGLPDQFDCRLIAIHYQQLPSEADSAISREGVGVKQDPGLRLQRVLHVHHRLVLEPRIFGEVVLVPLLVGAAILLVVPKISQLLLDDFSFLEDLKSGKRTIVTELMQKPGRS